MWPTLPGIQVYHETRGPAPRVFLVLLAVQQFSAEGQCIIVIVCHSHIVVVESNCQNDNYIPTIYISYIGSNVSVEIPGKAMLETFCANQVMLVAGFTICLSAEFCSGKTSDSDKSLLSDYSGYMGRQLAHTACFRNRNSMGASNLDLTCV